MGNKEYLQKELDFLLEKIRFWRYVLLAVISGIVGMLFTLASQKIEANISLLLLTALGFGLIAVAIKRIDTLDKEYRKLLQQLKDEP